MANPNPTLSFGLYRLPRVNNYVARTVDSSTGELTVPTALTGAQYSWGVRPWRQLDTILPNLEQVPVFGQPADFRATPALNGKSTWGMSWQCDPENSEAQRICAYAAQDDVFVIWYIQTEDDVITQSDLTGFLGSGVAAANTEAAPTVVNPTVLPRFTRRGMSGLVTEAIISELADGSGLLEIQGAGWGQALRETTHDNFSRSISDTMDAYAAITTRRGAIIRWLYDLFLDNSDFRRLEPTNTFGTQIGRWLIRPAITNAAITHLTTGDTANIDFKVEPGNHTMEDSLDDFCSRAGLVYFDRNPVLVFDVASKTTTTQVWGRAQYSSASLRVRRPRATGYRVPHNDAASAVTVVRDNLPEVSQFGVIRRILPSTAPRRPAPEEGEEPEIEDGVITELLDAQIAAEAIRDEATQDADAEFPWVPGTRWGIDWNLNDWVQVNVMGVLSIRLPVASVAVRMAGGNWSFRPGMGRTADIIPQFRHQIVERN